MATSLQELRRTLAVPLRHPGLTKLREIAELSSDWLLQHFATLPDQLIGMTGTRPELEALLREPPPEQGSDFGTVLREFETKVAPFAFRVNHPRFFAFIPSAPNYVSVFGDLLCAGANFFAGVWLEASGPAEVEVIVLDWFKELLGLPASAAGILTGGGSEANLTALVVARETIDPAGRDKMVLYLTRERHWSIDRAAKVMGLRPEQLRPIEPNEQFQLNLAALRLAVEQDRERGLIPWAVVANAGATNSGTVDPLQLISDYCRAEKLWLHVDAAYGWPAILVPGERPALAGIENADSITLDPHKWFAQPFEAGCVMVREGHRLVETFALRPDYMKDVEPGENEVSFCDMGIALTRRFRALKIWLSVKVLGIGWFRDLVERCCRLADLAQGLLEETGEFEILCSRQLSIVCFRYAPPGADEEELNRINLTLVERLRGTGRAFISSTRLHGAVALRLCFVNWRTTAADVEETIRLLGTQF
jgi:glutamate/tyrosine decarboxylase-like PLP-dependent enzyme